MILLQSTQESVTILWCIAFLMKIPLYQPITFADVCDGEMGGFPVLISNCLFYWNFIGLIRALISPTTNAKKIHTMSKQRSQTPL